MFVEGDRSYGPDRARAGGDQTDGWWGGCGGFKVPVLGVALGATGRDPMRFVVRNVSAIGAETGDADWPFTINGGMGVFGFMLRRARGLHGLRSRPAVSSSSIPTTAPRPSIGTSVWSVEIEISASPENTSRIALAAWKCGTPSGPRCYIASNDVSTPTGGDTAISLLQNTLSALVFP